ncbi:MAG TPA: AGE family epimerase/isomerase [Bacteroidales bacterium]|nr:AGE family epimerase/isomerase [Bacteroidales bacterium]
MNSELLTNLGTRANGELTENILPFWINKAIDKINGGFYGQIDGYGKVIPQADKGGILNARILWTFSAAYNLLEDDLYLDTARMSLDYVLNHFFDNENGGTFWKITFDGKPSDTKKQIYSQAFFIYALSEFYKASNDRTSLEKAITLFRLIEEKSFDREKNGYFEAYSREWSLLEDLRLSLKDANEKKTTNTHLHILEAYTNLYQVWKNEDLEKQLRNLVNLFLDRIIDPVSRHMLLFFDENWNSRSSLVSYGHDIEASWLIYEGARVLGDKTLVEKARSLCVELGIASLEGFQPDGSMIYEKDDDKGIHDTDRHWWPQAETVVGLLNLHSLTGDSSYAEKAVSCWNYIEKYIIDRQNGEWYWSIKNGKPNLAEDKAGFWKCPYHNARACIEVIKRTY